MTTDEEIDRIREIRARRLETERQERGEQEQQQKVHCTSYIKRIEQRRQHRRVSAPSIGRQQLRDDGLLPNDRHHRNRPSRGELSSSQRREGEYRHRNDISTRLATRRILKYSDKKSSDTAGYSSEISNRRSDVSNEKITQQN